MDIKKFCPYLCNQQNNEMYQIICNMMRMMMWRTSAARSIA
ncbi:MAG: hypothetical protein R3206_00045 [Salegentibacter mishustinae]|nr:hypothetical protein [Salegentibacter mishustinae]